MPDTPGQPEPFSETVDRTFPKTTDHLSESYLRSQRLRLISRQKFLRIQLESMLWTALALGYPAYILLSIPFGAAIFSNFFFDFLRQPVGVFLTCLFLLFPILFALIFGHLPFATLHNWLNPNAEIEYERISSTSTAGISDEQSIELADNKVSPSRLEKLNPRQLLAFYAERTSQITQRIYNRAGVYLLVGVLISFSGLAFFYIRTAQLSSQTSEVTSDLTKTEVWPPFVNRILFLAPGFGILFFIEFIAFFFLRQYRSVMDEFRYFDSIRRQREETLIILKMFQENETIVPTKDVIDAARIYSSATTLSKDQTTEMLEARRMQKDELIVFEKLVDVLSTLRNADPKKEDEKKKK